jgi:hypothetical protein
MVDGKADPISEVTDHILKRNDFAGLLRDKTVFEYISPDDRKKHMEYLDNIGYMRVAEHVSAGRLSVEFAFVNKIPLMVFAEWWNGCPPEILNRANVNHAETAVLKAELVLSQLAPDKETAEVMKALADNYKWRAERMNPSRWNPGKAEVDSIKPIIIEVHGDVPSINAVFGSTNTVFGNPDTVFTKPPPIDVTLAGSVVNTPDKTEMFTAEDFMKGVKPSG